jgi:hypothetical protein
VRTKPWTTACGSITSAKTSAFLFCFVTGGGVAVMWLCPVLGRAVTSVRTRAESHADTAVGPGGPVPRDRSLRTVLYFIMYGSPIRYVHHMHTLRYAQRVHQHRTCAHDDSSMYSMSCACAPQHTLPYFIVNFGSRHRHGHAPHPNQSYS